MRPQVVLTVDPAGEEVERKPAALILEVGLIAKEGSAPCLSQVFSLNEQRVRVEPANLAHRQLDGPALMNKSTHHEAFVARMRVPMTVERGEASRGQWLIDGGVGVNPWIALRHGASEGGEVVREG